MDHRTVFFEFHTLVKAPVRTHRSVYDYAKGDFDGLRNALRSVNLTSVKTCALAQRCRNEPYQEKGNRMQETKIAPVRVTKSQISSSRLTPNVSGQY